MLTILRSLISSLRHYWETQRKDTNEEKNEQRKERIYPQSYPTKCKHLDVEKWQTMCYSLEGEFTSQIDMIMAFDADSAIIKCKDNMVYGVGDNVNGRLGLSIKDHYYIIPEKVDELCGKNIISFHCSSDEICFYALTEEGNVYCWGINRRYKLGIEFYILQVASHTPIKMDLKDEFRIDLRITQIACNSYNCLAMTDSGKIYIWGFIEFTNEYIQIELRHLKIFETRKIVQIACGMSFIVALTDDGKLCSWDLNENGQLGIIAENDCMTPRLITSLENVKIDKIVCGSEHSLALTSEGKIYSWGNNCKGQLGHGERFKLKREPTIVIHLIYLIMIKEMKNREEIKTYVVYLTGSAMGTISDIAAQHDTSAAVNKLGSVYVWAFLRHNIWKPIRIECSNMHNVFRYKISHIIPDSTRKQSNTLEYLKTLFDDQSTSDFTIEVEEKHIYVHKAILIRCDYFKNMFQHGWREARKNTLKCNDFPYNVYKVFLKYLYTDVVDHLSLEETFELLKLCNKYTERNVAKKCVEVIKENLNTSNVALCFAIAVESNAKDLVEYCIQFSSGQMSNIMKSDTFVNLSEELLLDFLMRTNDAGNFTCRWCSLQL